MSSLDLAKKRNPSDVRDLLEVRVRRISGTKPEEVRVQALQEIRDIADASLKYDYGLDGE